MKQKNGEINETIEESIEVFYKPDTIYEITINPEDNWQYEGEPLRVSRFTNTVNLIKGALTDNTFYYLVPEISECRNSNPYSTHYPRIHYHGIILIKSVQEFLLQTITKIRKIGSFQINNYRPDYWPKYIAKQRQYIELKKIGNCSFAGIKEKERPRNEIKSEGGGDSLE